MRNASRPPAKSSFLAGDIPCILSRMSSVLDRIDNPGDVKLLDASELKHLAEDIRGQIINTLSFTGGHLGANLGVVDLTIALLRVFSPPEDKLVWDVSHQTYPYKLLTGRRDRFCTLRQYGGLSGFTKRSESQYDAFGAGHAGTALSAALGMAVARDRRKGKDHVVAIVGDASASNGISLEALNNVNGTTGRLIVVLNDNEMSISANVGALSRYLGSLLANPRYNRLKRSVEDVATRLRMGWLRSKYYKIEETLKSLFLRSVMFEEVGLRYIGPIDGHNIPALTDALTIARDSEKPILLHVTTKKGKGYSYAEDLPEKWHGIPQFDVASGEPVSKGTSPTYSSVFGSVLERLAEQDERIVAITAAMCSGTGLSGFAKRFPDRFFDVGIAEEHAAVFAAGLATEGLVPVFAVYSTFAQRIVDCVIHDICLQGLPVVLCLDRAGVVGDDGPTHHGVFDIGLLRPVPGLVIMQPKDEAELAQMLHTAVNAGCPVAIRYPRGCGCGAAVPHEIERLEIGRAEVLREGREVQIWALGDMIPLALGAASILEKQGIRAGVVNPRFVRPLDVELMERQSRTARVFVSVENGVAAGGFGTGLEEALVEKGFEGRIARFGWPHEFVPQGAMDVLMSKYGLTPGGIAERVAAMLGGMDDSGGYHTQT